MEDNARIFRENLLDQQTRNATDCEESSEKCVDEGHIANEINSDKKHVDGKQDSVFIPMLRCGDAAQLNESSDNNSHVDIGANVSESSVLSFQNLSYKVNVRNKAAKSCCRPKVSQYIVKDASGVFGPGINAILGPTGSGKTTLLDILADRKNPEGLSGEVLVNGCRKPSNFKCMIGYVIQDDVVMGMLTVRENIEFSASLRLPSGTSAERRKEIVEEIISDLGLSNCAKTKIGTEFQRGVSGGERKRANIAIELITSPAILFLDEPTTGLDAFTAHSVMNLLKRLSLRGMTIILSIHQPRYSIFKLFDTMMLLSGGECVFYGPAKDALEYFRLGDYNCEEHNNPPDFFLDVLSGCIPSSNLRSSTSKESVEKHKESTDHSSYISNGINKNSDRDSFLFESKDCITDIRDSLVSLYRSSKWHRKLEGDLSTIHMKKALEVVASKRISYPTSVFTQLAVVSSRTWHNMIRNRNALITQLFSAVILGLIVGSIYFQVDDSCSTGIENRVGAFFFIVINFVFGNMSTIDVFIKERAIFVHETLSGFYRVSAYFFAKLVCDVVPQKVFPIILFALITYFMIGFENVFTQFLFYVLNIIMTGLSGTAVALMLSASTTQHSIGALLLALVYVCMMVFSGRMVNIDTIPVWLQWLKWISIFRYSLNAFMVNELKGFECSFPSNTTFFKCTSGNECLTMYGVPHSSAWDLWSNEVALLILTVVFLSLTYIQLRRTSLLK